MLLSVEHDYNILCIDDNQNNLFTLSSLFQSVSHINTIEALGAKEGLDKLLHYKIDLILLDVQMPEMNGFEVAKLIKSNKKTKHIPIIFLTAVFKSEEFIREGFELGAVDYLTKPIDDKQLLNKVSLYLEIFEKNNRLMQSEKKFYDIAQSIGDGIYTLDLDGKVTFINKQALKLLGFNEKELIGKVIHEYIHYKDIQNHPISTQNCPIHKSMIKGETIKNSKEYLIKKDGTFLSISIVVTPLYLDEKLIGSVSVFHDKTEKEKILELEKEKIQNQQQMIYSMVDMIESRDSYTAGHTKRVAHYCTLIAKEMGCSEEEIELLKNAAWLHDIGKISTPDSILLKPSKLNDVEYELIQEHLSSGYEMLSKIDQYKEIADIMGEHHEKYDGSGYPKGLKGDAIRPLSRIMIVADAFDAMTTNRVYKPRKSVKVALNELQELSAKHFHPEVVSMALRALKDIKINLEITQLPKSEIEKQRFSYFYTDRLTGLYIIEYLPLFFRYYMESQSIYLYNVKLHNFTRYNKEFGWKTGDEFLVEFAHFLDNLYEDGVVFRVEGDDFILLSQKQITTLQERLYAYFEKKNTFVDFSVHEEFVEDIQKYEFQN